MTAACAGLASATFDPWFSDDPAEREWAKALCAGCSIADACRDGAMERGEQHGTWGGVTFGVLEMATADELVAELLPAMAEHGTRAAYLRCTDDDGRACGECRAANAAYVRGYRDHGPAVTRPAVMDLQIPLFEDVNA